MSNGNGNGNGYDPFDAAMHPAVRKGISRWFGQLFVDVYACVLTKGVGKEPFNPNAHDAAKKQPRLRRHSGSWN